MLLDELPPRLDLVAHEDAEDAVGRASIVSAGSRSHNKNEKSRPALTRRPVAP
jgi:hypothetical protein